MRDIKPNEIFIIDNISYQMVGEARGMSDGSLLVVFRELLNYNNILVCSREEYVGMNIILANSIQSDINSELCEEDVNADSDSVVDSKTIDSGHKLDELLEEYLDSQLVDDRIDILVRMHSNITDEQLSIMAIVVDIELQANSTEERYQELYKCLNIRKNYEGNRLR